MVVMDQEVKSSVDMACKTGEEFTKHFYENMDKRRHLINRLYLDNANIAWNGNGIVGKEEIAKFLINMPVTEHKLCSLDSQQISATFLPSKLAYLIKVTGTVKYQAKLPRVFTQTFIITNHEEKWKIVSDCFRLQDPLV